MNLTEATRTLGNLLGQLRTILGPVSWFWMWLTDVDRSCWSYTERFQFGRLDKSQGSGWIRVIKGWGFTPAALETCRQAVAEDFDMIHGKYPYLAIDNFELQINMVSIDQPARRLLAESLGGPCQLQNCAWNAAPRVLHAPSPKALSPKTSSKSCWHLRVNKCFWVSILWIS